MRLLLAVLLVVALTSCAVRRRLEVTSTPPGAEIRLDDRKVGTTPMRIEFHHYGIRRLTLYKDGYRTHTERVHLRPPWFARFPVDLISEILLPFGWKDERAYHVDLIEGKEIMSAPALSSVFERADILRRAGPHGPDTLPAAEIVELRPLGEEPGEEAPSEVPQDGEPPPDRR